ncbi:MAG: hypothetical protein ACOX3G_11965 [Armatimonadota bacterium]|jgi:hypothetical protein
MRMVDQESGEIGRGWVVAIVALVVLLILGIVLYLRMSAPLKQQPKRPVSVNWDVKWLPGFAECDLKVAGPLSRPFLGYEVAIRRLPPS